MIFDKLNQTHFSLKNFKRWWSCLKPLQVSINNNYLQDSSATWHFHIWEAVTRFNWSLYLFIAHCPLLTIKSEQMMKLFLVVLSLITTFSSATPKFSLVEVENKEGHGQEDEGLAQDQLVVGGQSHDDRDYRMVMILLLFYRVVLFYLNGLLQRCPP